MTVLVSNIEMDCYNSLCIPEIITLRFTSGSNVKYEHVDKRGSLKLSSRNAVTDHIPQEFDYGEQKQSDKNSKIIIEEHSKKFGHLDLKYKAAVQEAELLFTKINVEIKKHAQHLEKMISQNWSGLSKEMLDQYRRIKKNIEGRGDVLNNSVRGPLHMLYTNSMETEILKKEEILWLREELRKGGCEFGKRLFATSQQGSCIRCFHSKCNGKGATLTVVSVPGLSVFGGFTTTPWSSNGTYVWGDNTWLFKLEQDNYQRIGIKPECRRYSVYHHSNYGPTFGHGHDIFIGEKNGKISYCKMKAFSDGILGDHAGDTYYFNTMEYEVFQVHRIPKVIV